KIIWYATCIMAAVILIAAAVMLFAHIRPAIIVSGSMEPVIHTGSMVFIDSDYRDFKERDIVAFETGGVMVTHRIVQITDEGFVTKGDANEKEDPAPVPESAFRGRLVMWLPYLGYAARALTSAAGITATAAFYMLLLLIYLLTGKGVRINDTKKNTDYPDSSAA
ncbi:MAG: signal peptidase I, partial [Bacillota bacterium]|nr:signal peptidase I [Bacillota bacterium]